MNKKFINMLITKVIMKILTDIITNINMLITKVIMKILTDIITNEVCCMNCEYYYVNSILDNSSYCTIDKEIIEPEISHIIKCKAFSTWFGIVD